MFDRKSYDDELEEFLFINGFFDGKDPDYDDFDEDDFEEDDLDYDEYGFENEDDDEDDDDFDDDDEDDFNEDNDFYKSNVKNAPAGYDDEIDIMQYAPAFSREEGTLEENNKKSVRPLFSKGTKFKD